MAEWIIDDDEWVMTGGEHAVRHELIRCKDCKWHEQSEKFDSYCNHLCTDVPEEWFCADGERKEQ